MADSHTLYTFRRCPYAMRARLALLVSGLPMKVRELVLRSKPDHMLEISPKGTVPVLWLGGDQVVDESLEIMHWALKQSDPEGWLDAAPEATKALIVTNDGPFKRHLDRYKYPSRYPEENIVAEEQRDLGLVCLRPLNDRLVETPYLFGEQRSLADMAIFPFVRQFAHVDKDWFFGLDMKPLHTWLKTHLESDIFQRCMIKYPLWQPGDEEPLLGVKPEPKQKDAS